MSALPEGWSNTTLAKVAQDISYGFTTSAAAEGENAKLLRITDVQDYSVDWAEVPICKDAPPDDKLLKSGDIVIARTGATTGKSFLLAEIPRPTAFASYLIRVRSSAAVDPHYLWKFMWSPDYWRQITVVSKGTAQPGANASILGGLELPLPPLPEQRRIVAKLDRLSARTKAARAHLVRVQSLASRAKQATLAAAFDPAENPAWRMSTVEKVLAEGLIGLVRSKAQQSDQGTPYIRMNHYDLNGRWNDKDLTFVEVSAKEFQRFELRPQDLLFNTRNSAELVGKVALWPEGRPGHVFNNNLLRMRFRKEIKPAFAYFYMISPVFREFLESVKNATTSVAAIYQKSLMRGPFPVPEIEEQKAIVRCIETTFARIDRMVEEAASAAHLLDRLDQRLLAKAFRGELVPQDPNDEPAADLLARIQAARAAAPKPKRGRRTRA